MGELTESVTAEVTRLVGMCVDLVDDATDAAGEGGGVLAAIEQAAQQTGAGIGLAAIAAVLDYATTLTPGHRVECPNGGSGCGHRVRLVARRSKTVRTLVGSVDVERGYYSCRDCRRGFAPVDGLLGVVGTSLSPGLVRASAVAGREMSYAKSGELITTVTGLDLASTSTLARATRAQGRKARALLDSEHAAARPGEPAGVGADSGLPDKCYVVMDGTGAPMLPSEVVGRQGKDGGRAGTREVKIGCFFTQTGLDPTTGEPVHDPESVSYTSTFEPAGEFGDQCVREYWRRSFDQVRQPIVLGDGAHWIWNIAEEHFPAATQIVDYFHACEHLGDLTRGLADVLADPDSFKQALIDKLDIGDTAGIAAAIDGLELDVTAPDLVRLAATEVGYFQRNHHRMQYADFKANGYYIGSGFVESACNTIVKQRAKRAGMHWTIEGLDPVIALRTLNQSGRDEVLWPQPQT